MSESAVSWVTFQNKFILQLLHITLNCIDCTILINIKKTKFHGKYSISINNFPMYHDVEMVIFITYIIL